MSAGLREDVDSGSRRRERNERRFEQQMGLRREAESEPQPGDTEEGRARARETLQWVKAQQDGLAGQLRTALNSGDRDSLATLYQRKRELEDTEQEAYRHLGGAELRGFVNEAQQTADDLHHGRRTVAELSPRELNHFVAYATGHPVADVLDTADGPSKLGRKLQDLHEGIANLRGDGGAQFLGAVNGVSHDLDGLIGQHAYDGSTVTGAEFAPPVPHPDDPGQMLVTAKLTTRDPVDGRVGTVHVPVTEERGRMLAHPEERADATVKTIGIGKLLHHYGALESMYRAVNADPEIRGKLIDSFLQGDDDRARRMLDWLHVLGHEPEGWLPGRRPEMRSLPYRGLRGLDERDDLRAPHEVRPLPGKGQAWFDEDGDLRIGPFEDRVTPMGSVAPGDGAGAPDDGLSEEAPKRGLALPEPAQRRAVNARGWVLHHDPVNQAYAYVNPKDSGEFEETA